MGRAGGKHSQRFVAYCFAMPMWFVNAASCGILSRASSWHGAEFERVLQHPIVANWSLDDSSIIQAHIHGCARAGPLAALP